MRSRASITTVVSIALGMLLTVPASGVPRFHSAGATVSTAAQAGIRSDEFNAGSLDASVWTFVDSVGDSSLTMTGSQAQISLPAGVQHDLWTNALRAPRLVQSVSDADFEVEAKLDGALTARYQMQGIVAQQDFDDLVRVDVYYDGATTRLFAATFVGGVATARHSSAIPGGDVVYLRLKRAGTTWTLRYSADGANWSSGASFTHALALSAVGVFAGNSGSTPPAFAAKVDYFREVVEPPPPPADTTPPTISAVTAAAQATSASIAWTTDEPADSRVEYGTTTSYGAAATDTSATTSHSVELTALSCGTLYHYRVRSADAAGNAATSVDLTFTTAACPTGIQSDEFNGPALDTSVWSFVDPVGDGSLSFDGAHAVISLPAGVQHDLWTNALRAPRLLQPAPNADFEVEAKFDAPLTARYQMQGVVAQQDANNLLRADVYYDGSQTRLFAAKVVGGVATALYSATIPAGTVLYFRVKRTGDTWALTHSRDGTTWTAARTFTHALTVTAVGPFAGNSGSPPPAFAASVDYFRSVTSDPPPPPPPDDTTPPAISAVNATAQAIAATVTWTTDEAANSKVEYGLTTSYGSTVTDATFVTSHTVGVTGLSCSTTYHYRIISADPSGNVATSGDRTFTTTSCTSEIRSDEFDGASIDSSVWSLVDPVGDATLGADGTNAVITLPAGVQHDLWTGANRAPRLLQSSPNVDFEVEVKFTSTLAARYQQQGLVVQQDLDDLVRVDFFHDGAGTKVFAATMVAGVAQTRHSSAIASATPLYLRLKRAGNTWTLRYSVDGSSWTTKATFTHTLVVSAIGPFAGNAGSPPPAWTAKVDYFRLVPPPPPDTTAPLITNVVASPSTRSAVVTWSTDEPATSAVDFGPTAAYESGTAGSTSLVSGHSVTLTGLACESLYHYRVRSRDGAGNERIGTDQTFTTNACSSGAGPEIDVWYGDTQTFGSIGVPQRWINVLGTVSDPEGVSTLQYSLNGGVAQSLTIGPDGRRLAYPGDFNIELDRSSLLPGNNTVAITATDINGDSTVRGVTVVWQGPRLWPLPYTAHWTTTSEIPSVAQIVEGKWAASPGALRTVAPGYDRFVTIGDVGWTNYEVRVPFTMHYIDPAEEYVHVGIGIGWQGHTGSAQPRFGHPYGGLCSWTRWAGKPMYLSILENRGSANEFFAAKETTGRTLDLGVEYVMKFRQEALPSGNTRYVCKVWPSTAAEPTGWDLSVDVSPWTGEIGPHPGSALLLAHEADVTFGDPLVVPLGQ